MRPTQECVALLSGESMVSTDKKVADQARRYPLAVVQAKKPELRRQEVQRAQRDLAAIPEPIGVKAYHPGDLHLQLEKPAQAGRHIGAHLA